MTTTVHLRNVSRERLVAAVESSLAEEGFARVARGDASGRVPPELRRIVVYENGGWSGLGDDPYADATWGERLSKQLAVPVFVLSGERDHVFYSEVAVYEGGRRVAASKVPEDAVLEADGRHRIRPLTLADYIPSAKDKLAAGIVVHPDGGEPNMVAVAEVLGIPQPLVGHTEEDDEDALVLFFRVAGRTTSPRPRSPGAAASLFGQGAEVLLGGLLSQLVPGARRGGEMALDASATSNGTTASVGATSGFHVSFGLVGGESARGLVIEVSGDGLALLDPAELVVRDGAGNELEASAERDDGIRRYRFPKLVLRHAPSPRLDELAPGERLRRGVHIARSLATLQDPARVTIYGRGEMKRAGKGTFVVRASTVDPAGLHAESEFVLDVRPRPEGE